MGSINKRVRTSYGVMVSVDDIKRYKDIINRDCSESLEYCEAKIALEHAIPEWLARKAWSIAKEIHFMQQIIEATGHEWYALDDINRNLKNMGY